MSKKNKSQPKKVEPIEIEAVEETTVESAEVPVQVNEPAIEEIIGKGAVCLLIGKRPLDATFANELTVALGKLGFRTVSEMTNAKVVLSVGTQFESSGYLATIGDKPLSIELAKKIEDNVFLATGLRKASQKNVGNIGNIPALVGFDFMFDSGHTDPAKAKLGIKLVAAAIAKAIDSI